MESPKADTVGHSRLDVSARCRYPDPVLDRSRRGTYEDSQCPRPVGTAPRRPHSRVSPFTSSSAPRSIMERSCTSPGRVGRRRDFLKGPHFGGGLSLSIHENFWCKVTCPERLSVEGPPHFRDVVPFARRVIKRFPSRVLWGTDWPHPNLHEYTPDDGAIVDFNPRLLRRRTCSVDSWSTIRCHCIGGTTNE